MLPVPDCVYGAAVWSTAPLPPKRSYCSLLRTVSILVLLNLLFNTELKGLRCRVRGLGALASLFTV